MRPLRSDAQRNRARLLEIAEKTFASEGLGVTISEIARQAGVGVGTVYRHFPTKEALFGAIVVDRIQKLVDHAQAAMTDTDPGEAFFGFFTRLVEEAVQSKALVHTLSEAAGLENITTSGVTEELMSLEGKLLRRAQKAGAVRPDVTVKDLKALITGCLAMVEQHDNPKRMVAIVTDGLRPH